MIKEFPNRGLNRKKYVELPDKKNWCKRNFKS